MLKYAGSIIVLLEQFVEEQADLYPTCATGDNLMFKSTCYQLIHMLLNSVLTW